MNFTYNGRPRETADHTTVAQLLEQLQLNPRQLAVEVNTELIPRERHADVVLREGDRVEVVTLAGGG